MRLSGFPKWTWSSSTTLQRTRPFELASLFPVHVERRVDNRGFSYGNNIGLAFGRAPFVLFLNPDATIDERSLRELIKTLEADPRNAIAAPQILNTSGSVSFSLRRFPRLRSTYAQALFLHRVFPRAAWADEVVRDPDAYGRPCSPDWVSGACMVVRRGVLDLLGGWDSSFFMYREDIDLCRRVRSAGFDVRFVPNAVALHQGGASMPRAALLPVLAASRMRYVQKHDRPIVQILEQAGIGLAALTHLLVFEGRWGHSTRASSRAGLRGHEAAGQADDVAQGGLTRCSTH